MWATNAKILGIVLGTLALYTLIANKIPQVQSEVPHALTLGANVTPEQLVAAGEKVYTGIGGCTTCHGLGERAPTTFRLHTGERTDHVYLTGVPSAATARVEDGESHLLTASLDGDRLTVTLDGLRTEYLVAAQDSGGTGQIWLSGGGRATMVEELREPPVRPDEEHSGDAELTSPMPGSVVAMGVRDGQHVDAGAVVVTVEAMKMEHALSAPVDGVVELLVAVGDQVKVGQPLARVTAAGGVGNSAEAKEDES